MNINNNVIIQICTISLITILFKYYILNHNIMYIYIYKHTHINNNIQHLELINSNIIQILIKLTNNKIYIPQKMEN